MTTLADRMKGYEDVARHSLTRRVPVVLRVDGRAIHTWGRKLQKPFDRVFMEAMLTAAMAASREMQGFKLGYVQSDEASFLLTDYDDLTTEPWFGYCQPKLVSITASLMTARFAEQWVTAQEYPSFDARAFNVPADDVANYFLWRAKDWHRNSVHMYARAQFSHRQCHGKKLPDLHEMLHAVGRNWALDLTAWQRNGAWIVAGERERECVDSVLPRYGDVGPLVDSVLPKGEDA